MGEAMAPRYRVEAIRRARGWACASAVALALGLGLGCEDEGYLRPSEPGVDANPALEADAGGTSPQPFGVRSWQRALGSNAGLDTMHAVAITREGQVVVAGSTRAEVIEGHVLGPPGELKRVVLGLSADTGQVSWLLTEPGLGGAVAAHPAGGVVVTSADSLLRLDDRGQVAWKRELGGGGASAVAVGDDGAIYAAGATIVSLEPRISDVAVAAYEGDGALRWARRFAGGGESVAHAIAIAPHGELWIAGTHAGGLDLGGAALELEPGARRAGFVARLSEGGDVTFTQSLAGGEAIAIAGVGVDEEGGLYLAGTIDGPAGGLRRRESFLHRYGEAGERSWERRFGLSGRVHAMLVDADLGIVIGGEGGGELGGVELEHEARFLARYDEDGRLLGVESEVGASGSYRALAARGGALAAAGRAPIAGLRCAPESPRCEIYGLIEHFQRLEID
jgi:outer membrane protein assembly factor BamB